MSGFVYNEINGVGFFTVPEFEKHGAKAVFSTRKGGVTEGERGSLNLGFKGTERELTLENYRMFFEASGLPKDAVLTKQVHGDIILENAENHIGHGLVCERTIEADAKITDRKNISLVTLTADCVPVLLYSEDTHSAGSIHAGWRGTVARISQKTAMKLKDVYNADLSEMLAAIGPSIGPCCFETGLDVGDELIAEFGSDIAERRGEKYYIDLWECNRRQLIEAGLKERNIFVAEMCTKCEAELLHSYRRSSGVCGYLASVVSVK